MYRKLIKGLLISVNPCVDDVKLRVECRISGRNSQQIQSKV